MAWVAVVDGRTISFFLGEICDFLETLGPSVSTWIKVFLLIFGFSS